MHEYDFLIVGAGLFGAVFAHEATNKGKSCLVIDRRSHIAGNAYTEDVGGIQVHKYGAHIFHTSNKAIWEYVNLFSEFNNYVNSPVARYGGKLYNLPFNMNTFYQLWGVKTPAEALAIIKSQRGDFGVCKPTNLEEHAVALVGKDIYEKLIKGYTEKQWGRSCTDLPASIIKRIPVRFTFDNNYFNDRYQGIPIGGYTKMVKRMLHGCEVKLNCDYFEFIRENEDIAEKTIFTGAIDEFFSYQLGALEYRSLRFESSTMDMENYQGSAVINYTDIDVPYTRVVEHKHFEFGKQLHTVVTHEYPVAWQRGMEAYYPINDERNTSLYQQYKALADADADIFFGGRLGRYAYYDMDKAIYAALELASLII